MKSIVKSYRQKGFVFWKMKVAIFCWEINRFISADWNSHRKADVTAEDVRRCLGEKHTTGNQEKQQETTENFADNSYHILLAHNPSYMEAYKEWGSDLILSGHLHGGCVRLPGIGGVITPQAFLFPKYSGEMTVDGKQTIIVSKGLGTHTFNVRLFNPAEVIAITLCR